MPVPLAVNRARQYGSPLRSRYFGEPPSWDPVVLAASRVPGARRQGEMRLSASVVPNAAGSRSDVRRRRELCFPVVEFAT